MTATPRSVTQSDIFMFLEMLMIDFPFSCVQLAVLEHLFGEYGNKGE